jgi:protein-disulfide isomerase
VTPAPPRAPRTPLWVALALSAAGVAVSLLLVRVHAQAHAGIASFCTINDVVNCDRVATSPYSVFLGIPVALWGVFGYLTSAALSIAALRSAARSVAWVGLLLAEAALAVAVSIVLAVVSEAKIGALCLLCAGSWILSIALLVCAWRACRERGVAAALDEGRAMARRNAGWTAVAAAAAAVAIAGASYAYPRYWDRPKARPAPAMSAATAGGSGSPGSQPSGGTGTGAPPVVVEYSDYECPFCARAHEETRELREKRPDITIVRRQFPLDMSCNPLVKQPMHPSSCMLSRAALCAQEQGRFTQMDDALFRNQREHLAVAELAQRVGLDVQRLQTCMASPATERRLESDIAAGIRDGVRATPTYVVGGVARSGEFPWELLPPPPSAGGGQVQSQRKAQ